MTNDHHCAIRRGHSIHAHTAMLAEISVSSAKLQKNHGSLMRLLQISGVLARCAKRDEREDRPRS